MLPYSEYTKILVGMIAIVNPVGAIPIFVAMTAGADAAARRNVANTVAVTVVVILMGSLFLGEGVLRLFGISIHSFRVGGGILLLLVAISMLQAKVSPIVQTDDEARESKAKESIAVVPLAIPLLAGPGAISTVILDAHRATGLGHYSVIAAEIVALGAMLWGVLRLSPLISERISATGINIVTRIMGLILAAIAIEFIASGARGLFPALG